MSAPRVVSIGMTHPQNIAGLGVDLRVAGDYAVRHTMVVAAVSAQNEAGVQSIFPLPADVVLKQIASVRLSDADVIRIGALGSAKIAELVDNCLCDTQVVFDPVMRSSAGGALYVDDPREILESFGGGVPGTVITPNIDEAHVLTGQLIRCVDDMVTAGKAFLKRGIDAVLLKGGHLPGDPTDVLVTDDGVETFTDTRLPQRMRGTGCRLAMALACELAHGRDLVDAVKGARAYVRANIARS